MTGGIGQSHSVDREKKKNENVEWKAPHISMPEQGEDHLGAVGIETDGR